uniref:Uncharacterized protein n=1 Tax=Arundo donax TaxID=35708 RepID=A0A0A9BNR8_ARUDO
MVYTSRRLVIADLCCH